MKKKIMPILAVVLLVTMMPMTVLAADHCGVTGAGQITKTATYTSTYNHFYGLLYANTCRVTDHHKIEYYQCVECGSTWSRDTITSSEHSSCGA